MSRIRYRWALAASALLHGSWAAAEEAAAKDQASIAPQATASGESVASSEPASLDDQARLERAKALFSEGRRLSNEALYDQACPLFEQSLALENRPSTQFNLAECWERMGRLASARALYERVAQRMKEAGDGEREKVARRRADLLQGRLCGLSIEPRVEPNLEITVQGKPLDPAYWGVVAPVDSGTYVVRAQAPGKKAWSTEVEVEACPNLVSVKVPKLAPDGPSAVDTRPTRGDQRRPSPAPEREPGSRFPVLPVAIAGVGVGALVVGTVFASQYKSKDEDARAVCPQSVGCSRAQVETHAELVSDAKTARTWAYVGFGVGGAALVGAAVLYLTGDYGASTPTRGRWNVTPLAGVESDTWGAVLSRDF